jgi:hypothetical protein
MARARAIYDSLTKAANGKAPTDRKVVEALAHEGFGYTVARVAQWRKAGAWAADHGPDLSPVLRSYAIDEHLLTYEDTPSPEVAQELGEGHRRSHLKMRKLLDDWLDGTCRKDLTVAEAFKLFEKLVKDRETAESCEIRLDQHRAATAKDVTPSTGVVDNDDAATERDRAIKEKFDAMRAKMLGIN